MAFIMSSSLMRFSSTSVSSALVHVADIVAQFPVSSMEFEMEFCTMSSEQAVRKDHNPAKEK